jgi:hypothetical protein
MINAVGSGPKLAFHKTKDPVTLSLLPVGGGGACVCEGKPAPFGSKKGKLHYTPTNQTGEKGPEGDIAWGNSCAAAPRTVLLEQQNPTCDIRTYVGGQTACHHMWSLLDADQDIPWPDQVRQRLSFAMPFCIYYLKNAIIYQDRLGTTIGTEHSNKEIYALSYSPSNTTSRSAFGSSHTSRSTTRPSLTTQPGYAKRVFCDAIFMQMRSFCQDRLGTNIGKRAPKKRLPCFLQGIASPVEYDVPKCNATVPGCSPVPGSSNPNGAEGKEWIHTIEGVYKGSGNLSAAHFHCHAPT